jgi:hypothetical protein
MMMQRFSVVQQSLRAVRTDGRALAQLRQPPFVSHVVPLRVHSVRHDQNMPLQPQSHRGRSLLRDRGVIVQ